MWLPDIKMHSYRLLCHSSTLVCQSLSAALMSFFRPHFWCSRERHFNFDCDKWTFFFVRVVKSDADKLFTSRWKISIVSTTKVSSLTRFSISSFIALSRIDLPFNCWFLYKALIIHCAGKQEPSKKSQNFILLWLLALPYCRKILWNIFRSIEHTQKHQQVLMIRNTF